MMQHGAEVQQVQKVSKVLMQMKMPNGLGGGACSAHTLYVCCIFGVVNIGHKTSLGQTTVPDRCWTSPGINFNFSQIKGGSFIIHTSLLPNKPPLWQVSEIILCQPSRCSSWLCSMMSERKDTLDTLLTLLTERRMWITTCHLPNNSGVICKCHHLNRVTLWYAAVCSQGMPRSGSHAPGGRQHLKFWELTLICQPPLLGSIQA